MVENRLPEQRNIDIEGGNYNENIKGNYIEGNKGNIINQKEQKSSESLNINGSQLSNFQIGGVARRDMNVTQHQVVGTGESFGAITQADVVKLIIKLEELFRNSDLPEEKTAKAIKHLEAAKEEVQEKETDKDFAAKNLQRATKVLKEAGEMVESGTTLWQKIKPILKTISPWLGVAVSFFV